MIKFTEKEFADVSEYAFSERNGGFNPKLIESPNGDGVWDLKKKYAHIAPKYFEAAPLDIVDIYFKAIKAANHLCKQMDIPKKFWAGRDSTLRILHYPPEATTAPHTDFDLFTICMYRNSLDSFKYLSGEDVSLLQKARDISPGIHFGELMTEINGSKATEHEVVGTNDWQYSAVFFVIPDHHAALPSGLSVGEWIAERKDRSRKKI